MKSLKYTIGNLFTALYCNLIRNQREYLLFSFMFTVLSLGEFTLTDTSTNSNQRHSFGWRDSLVISVLD